MKGHHGHKEHGHRPTVNRFVRIGKENENKKRAAKENNQPKVSLKRDPGWPSDSKLVRTTGTTIENVTPLEYEFVV